MKMTVPLFFFPILIFMVLVLPPTNVIADPISEEAWARFGEVQKELKSLSADFEQTRQLKILRKPVVSTGRLLFQVPSRFRWQVLSLPSSEALFDGETLWLLYPDFKRAEKYPLNRQRKLSDLIAIFNVGMGSTRESIEKNYRTAWRNQGEEVILKLDPIAPEIKGFLQVIELTFDSRTYLLKRTQWTAPNGDVTETRFTNARMNVPVEAGAFQFHPGEGWEVTSPMNP